MTACCVLAPDGGPLGDASLASRLADCDADSVASDHSELSAVVGAHLAAEQTGGAAERAADETEAAFRKRLRKQNYLSLAQEFAALQRCGGSDGGRQAAPPDDVDSGGDDGRQAAPPGGADSGGGETRAAADNRDKMDDFDVYNIETTLPNWDQFEERLRQANEEDRQKSVRMGEGGGGRGKGEGEGSSSGVSQPQLISSRSPPPPAHIYTGWGGLREA